MTDLATHPTQAAGAWLADTRPAAFAIEGQASEADGVIDAWFSFETAVARGRGHLRLKNARPGRC